MLNFHSLLAPRPFLALASLLCLVLAVTSLRIATSPPSLGISLAAIDAEALEVRAGLASGPYPGERVAALGAPGQETVALSAQDLVEEPDFINAIADYNAFFIKQSKLHALLHQPEIWLYVATGERYLIKPQTRKLTSVPHTFYFQIICGAIAWMIGISVLAYNLTSWSARFYALTGFAFMLVTFSAAAYSSRELALAGDFFRFLNSLNHVNAYLFSAAFISLLWNYPARLGSINLPVLVFVLGAYATFAEVFQWVDSNDLVLRYPVLLGLLAALVLAFWQWRTSLGDPLRRAAIKWFLLTLLLGSSAFVFLVFGLLVLGYKPLITQAHSFALVLPMYAGMALGMTRHQLFNLDRWWNEVWIWLVSGTLVVVTDLILLYVLQLNEVVSISLAIAIAGWIYFPLRQWILSRILLAGRDDLHTLFPKLIDLVFDPRGEVGISERWAEFLQQVFQPQSLQRIAIPGNAAAVRKAGLHLIVPDVGGLNKQGQQQSHSLELAYAGGGKRLFTEADARLAQAMWALLAQAMVAQKAFLRGTLAERERIYRDLHDGLGGIATNISLLSELAQQETSPVIVKQKLATISELSREGLDEIRSFMRDLDATEADWQSVIADMRVNGRKLFEPHGIAFHFEATVGENLPDPDSVLRFNLFRICKEALVNVIKHAQAKNVTMRIAITPQQMQLEIADDGIGCTQSQALAEKSIQHGASAASGGRGLPNLKTRAHALGGTLTIDSGKGTRVKLHVSLPIKYPEQGMAGGVDFGYREQRE